MSSIELRHIRLPEVDELELIRSDASVAAFLGFLANLPQERLYTKYCKFFSSVMRRSDLTICTSN